MLMFDDRFARQNRFGLPSEFPLTSTYTSIVHHLSGRNMYAHASPQIKFMRASRYCATLPWDCGSYQSLTAMKTSHLLRLGVSEDPLTCVHVTLLGPCFKTGRVDDLLHYGLLRSNTEGS